MNPGVLTRASFLNRKSRMFNSFKGLVWGDGAWLDNV